MTREKLAGEPRTGTALARAVGRAAPALRMLPLVALLGMGGCGIWGGRGPSEEDQKIRLSAVLLSNGAVDAALFAADEVLAKQPRNVAALEARGNALAALDRVEEAQQAYLQAIAISPSNTSARLALGRLQIRLNPQAAEETLDQLVQREPRNVAALSNLGVARDLQGRHAEAQQAYRRALAADPKNTGAATNLGLSLVLSGNMAEAATVLQPLAEGPSPSEAVIENLAIALAATGDTAGASRQLARILPPDQVGPTLDSYRRVAVAPPAAPPAVPLAAATPPPAPVVAAPAAPAPMAPPAFAAAPPPPAPTPAPVQVAAPVVPPEAPRAAAPQPEPEPVPSPAVPLAAERAIASAPPTSPAPAPPAHPILPGEASATHAQVAMATTPEQAMETWDTLRARLPSGEAVPDLRVVSMAHHDRGMFALRAGPFGQPEGAARFCAEVRSLGGECWAMTPAPPALPLEAAIPAARTTTLASAPPATAAEPPRATPPAAAPPPPVSPAAAPIAPAPMAAAQAPAPAAPLPPGPAVPVATSPDPGPAPGGRVTFAQLAAVPTAQAVDGEWSRLRAKLGTLLAGRDAVTQTAEVGGRTVWRLRTGPFRAPSEAEAFCAEVRSAGGRCWSATVSAGS
jgi:Flp pilus assembly protein TadD